ncbi:hypothetical protein F511_46329 [Dorcoceras hygrometricum]|uniref:Uncharacterized protein n=1 Tax=Dorcoceras hygrometricum TaxID=472368 RepID=A0A2Z6ZTT5_9LAMI|nr:hypothetical protein F511_46329 [Dorcoceras hygrometricum]
MSARLPPLLHVNGRTSSHVFCAMAGRWASQGEEDAAARGLRWSPPGRRWARKARATLQDAGRAGVTRWCARCRREFFVVAAPPPAAAAPAMLRRISDDVVTADLNSFRVWFGPVPGSP